MPARAPASMLMLHSVMRASMERASTASPAYSMTCPLAPSVPMPPMMPRARSFAVTASGSRPRTRIRMLLGLRCGRHWVASTCSTSEVSMPKAKALRAPVVLFFFQAEDGIRALYVTGVKTCALPIYQVLRLDGRIGGEQQRRADVPRGQGLPG